MDFGLSGRVAVVTAASRGLGYASAHALLAEGASVLVCARDEGKLHDAVAQLRQVAKPGARVDSIALDVSSPDAATRLSVVARDVFGRVDVLVTNAGGPRPGSFDTVNDTDWEKSFQLTLMSVVRLMREFLPLLKASGQGRIINLSSASVRQPIDNLMLSNSMRLAVVGLAKSLAMEIASTGVTVNNVLPGAILTDRQKELKQADAERLGISIEQAIADAGKRVPVGRIGRPEEVGALVAFLASAYAGYITGTSILIDGGVVLGTL